MNISHWCDQALGHTSVKLANAKSTENKLILARQLVLNSAPTEVNQMRNFLFLWRTYGEYQFGARVEEGEQRVLELRPPVE